MTRFWMLLSSVVLVLSCASAVSAQGTPASANQKPITPVKIQIVISRFDGEKKLASLPYTLLGTDDSSQITLNLGLQVPVPSGANGANFNYKPVGTNMTCSVRAMPDGKFRLDLTVDSSSTVPDKSLSTPGNLPAFQSFTMHNALLLSEGQTVQYASVVDPVTGQVTKVDATLTLVR